MVSESLRSPALRCTVYVAFALTFAGHTAIVNAEVAASDLRYRFEIGDELVYEAQDQRWFDEEPDSKPEVISTRWRLLVTQAFDDGSWGITVEYVSEPGTPLGRRDLLGLRLHPDGSFDWNPTLAALPMYKSVRRILPKLSPKAASDTGWQLVEPQMEIH